jgi:hypothetical protein
MQAALEKETGLKSPEKAVKSLLAGGKTRAFNLNELKGIADLLHPVLHTLITTSLPISVAGRVEAGEERSSRPRQPGEAVVPTIPSPHCE